MPPRLPTGIDVLDQRLDGGIPPGSIIALCAPPASQAELLLYEFTVPRETLYLTLERTELGISDSLRRTAVDTGDPTVQYVAADQRIDHAIELFRDLPERSTLIVDPHTVIENEERSRFVEFMTQLRLHVIDTESLAVLHCFDGENVPELRDTTAHMADVVFRLTTDATGTTVENRLAVPKFRGGRALTETLKLRLTDQVAVDTSRDIA
jgi:KaiC/GvpD/RAD55 family RecA-like ATPase